eukprot:GAHX01001386.1.p1 GENE.GAHX01001386.1~~GAHX01001386.1.p1  ORF type:complete len:92 (+),score=13.37 GAHX01001386.1:42-278(+)
MKTKDLPFWKNNTVYIYIVALITILRDSWRFLKQCSKPNLEEYKKLIIAGGMGFIVMGLLGYMVKLIHIPINKIIVGA